MERLSIYIFSDQIENILNAILNDGLATKASYKDKIIRQNPDGRHTAVYFERPKISKDIISQVTLEKIEPILLSDKINKINKQIFPDWKNQLVSAFISEVNSAVIESIIVYQGLDNVSLFIKKSAVEISNWLNSKNDCYSLYIRFLNQFSPSNLNDWEHVELSWVERTKLAYGSGMSAEAFLSRLFFTTTYKVALPENLSASEVITYVDEMSLAIFITIWRPVHIDDLYLKNVTWEKCPFLPMYFHRMYGVYKYSERDASAVDFRSTCFNGQFPSFEVINSQLLDKSKQMLKDNIYSKYPFKKMMKGLWEILSSTNEPSFVSESQAQDGIHDFLIGLDGLIGEPIAKLGHRAYFEKMWRYILDNTVYEKNVNSRSHKKIISRLYDLRCELAHGSNMSVNEKMDSLFYALVGELDRQQVHPASLGYVISDYFKKIFHQICLKEDLGEKLQKAKSKISEDINNNL